MENEKELFVRLIDVETRVDGKLDKLRFWQITTPIVLLGAVVLSALGYFDYVRIPERIEQRITVELSQKVPIAVSDVLTREVSMVINNQLPEIAGPIIEQGSKSVVQDQLAVSVEPAVKNVLDSELRVIFGEAYAPALQRLAGISIGTANFKSKIRPAGDRWEFIDSVPVRFDRPYSVPPTVFISVTGIETYASDIENIPAYRFEAEEISEDGFKVSVYGAYLKSLTTAQVEWLAIDTVFQN